MNELFPPLKPFNEFELQVSDLHTIHVQESGNPNGKPAVFLHGGPGGGIEPVYRQYFDPDKWHLVLFDQRGCGKSTPFADLQENTTWDLVADIEKIRDYLKIDKWVVFGGSWGSTLSLAYSQTHPEHVKALILRGIFLLRKPELRWFYQEGASYIFPDAWEQYLEPIPKAERNDILTAYYKRLTDNNAEIRLAAARAWSVSVRTSLPRLLPGLSAIISPTAVFWKVRTSYCVISTESDKYQPLLSKDATMWSVRSQRPGIYSGPGRKLIFILYLMPAIP